MWEPYRSCADTLPLDYDRCVKEENRKKKWTEQCSATHPSRTTGQLLELMEDSIFKVTSTLVWPFEIQLLRFYGGGFVLLPEIYMYSILLL